jgi:hypothetical protein
MTKEEFCQAVADEFKSRWAEEVDGEVFEIAEYLLARGQLSISMSVDDAVLIVDRCMRLDL